MQSAWCWMRWNTGLIINYGKAQKQSLQVTYWDNTFQWYQSDAMKTAFKWHSIIFPKKKGAAINDFWVLFNGDLRARVDNSNLETIKDAGYRLKFENNSRSWLSKLIEVSMTPPYVHHGSGLCTRFFLKRADNMIMASSQYWNFNDFEAQITKFSKTRSSHLNTRVLIPSNSRNHEERAWSVINQVRSSGLENGNKWKPGITS